MVKLSPKAIEVLGEMLLQAPIMMLKSDGEQYCTRITNMNTITTKRALEIIHACLVGDIVILCAPDHPYLEQIGADKTLKHVHDHKSDVPDFDNPDKDKLS